MINAVLVEGLIYAIMVLGVFITFRILDFPDMTVDGSFATGACVMAISIINGTDLYVALGLSIIAGILAGVFTALLHTLLKIPNLLAGIITMTMLYSINTRILNNKGYEAINDMTNIVKNAKTSIESFFLSMNITLPDGIAVLIFFLIIALIIKFIIDLFFRTDLGISLGALGSNEQMIISNGMNPNTLKILGLGFSNGLVALSGAFYAQFSGSASVVSGQGIIVVGLAAVMIGELLVKSNKISFITIGVILGSIIYKGIIYIGLKYGYEVGLGPNDLKLISGVLIIVIITISLLKKKRVFAKMMTSLRQYSPNPEEVNPKQGFFGNCKEFSVNFSRMINQKFFKRRIAVKEIKSKVNADSILKLQNVSKTFGAGTPSEKKVLKNINLEINKGDFITIIGSNGAGKSTLFNVISGTYDVSGGVIQYKNKNITKTPEFKRAAYIGRIFQNPLLGTSGSMALEDNMILCRKKGLKLPVFSLNKKVREEFAKHVSRLNMGLEKRLKDNVGLFSGGQRQAFTLLMTAMSHPQLVLLDEHTAALDPDNSNRVMDLTLKLREEYDLTMMMITHNMQHAIKYGNRLLMMDNGEIIFDISGEEKQNLTIESIMEKFKSIRKDELNDEKLLLSR